MPLYRKLLGVSAAAALTASATGARKKARRRAIELGAPFGVLPTLPTGPSRRVGVVYNPSKPGVAVAIEILERILAANGHPKALVRTTRVDEPGSEAARELIAEGVDLLIAAGTVEAPGKNVRQKAGLNRSILDAAFSTLRRQLEYKASWYGSQVQIIDRFFASSQTCSACGARAKTKLDLRVRVFECAACGVRIDRDVNAARNIRAEAVRMYEAQLAPGTGESLNGRGVAGSDAAGSVVLGDVALDVSRPAAIGGGSP